MRPFYTLTGTLQRIIVFPAWLFDGVANLPGASLVLGYVSLGLLLPFLSECSLGSHGPGSMPSGGLLTFSGASGKPLFQTQAGWLPVLQDK